MATKPTPGGSDGTYGTELNEFLDIGHDSDGTHTKSQMLTDMAWSPTSYVGGESITFPNGLIIKTGSATSTQNAEETFTFGDAFPTACVSVQTTRQSVESEFVLPVTTIVADAFKIVRDSTIAGSQNFYWMAIGY